MLELSDSNQREYSYICLHLQLIMKCLRKNMFSFSVQKLGLTFKKIITHYCIMPGNTDKFKSTIVKCYLKYDTVFSLQLGSDSSAFPFTKTIIWSFKSIVSTGL